MKTKIGVSVLLTLFGQSLLGGPPLPLAELEPVLQVSPTYLSFAGQVGGPPPDPQYLTVANAGGGLMEWEASADEEWILLGARSGKLSGGRAIQLLVWVDVEGLEAGQYKGTITIEASAEGSPAEVDATLIVSPSHNQSPLASFTFSPEDPQRGEPVYFDASASTDADGTIQRYIWSFGDGTIGEGRTIVHIFRAYGTFTVSLTVVDNQGSSNTVSQNVDVRDPLRLNIELSETLEVSIQMEKGKFGTVYAIGEEVRILYTVTAPSAVCVFVYVLDINANRQVTLLFPNAFSPNNCVLPGIEQMLPDDPSYILVIVPPPGRECVQAIASLGRLDLEGGSTSDPFAYLGTIDEARERVLQAITRSGSSEIATDVTCFEVVRD